MKKIYFIFALCVLTLVSCKNESKSTEKGEKTTETSQYETFTGMFLYLEGEKAAVFQAGGSNMYGVVIDDQMLALNEQCKKYKTKEHDMVPVIIKGVKKPNPVKDAWKEVIEVKEVVSVQKPSENQDGTIIIKSNE